MSLPITDEVRRPDAPANRRLHVTGSHLVAALVVAALAAASAVALVAAEQPIYVTTSTMIIDQPVAIAASPDDGIIAKLARLKFKYANLLGTAPLAEPVASLAGVPVAEVIRSTTAEGPVTSQFLTITVRTADKANAARIANAAAFELGQFATTDQTNNGIPPAKQFTLRSLALARPPVQVRPMRSRAFTVGGSVGLLAGLVALVGVSALADLRRGRRA